MIFLRKLSRNPCAKWTGPISIYNWARSYPIREEVTYVKSNWPRPCSAISITLQWRHNGRDSVSNHQPHDCFLNRLFRRISKKTSKLRVTGLFVGNSPGTGELPAQLASNAVNVFIWWRHHEHAQHHGVDEAANGQTFCRWQTLNMMVPTHENTFNIADPTDGNPMNQVDCTLAWLKKWSINHTHHQVDLSIGRRLHHGGKHARTVSSLLDLGIE